MSTWFFDKVEKRGSEIEARGLFCVAPISSGEVVVVKGGHVFDRATRDTLAKTLGPAEIQIDHDLFIGPMTPDEREASMMCLNYSCAPNIRIAGQITFVALRNIEPGEELPFDYATGDDDAWTMDCACGAETCRGLVTGKDWQDAAFQKQRKGTFAHYLELRIAESRR